MIITHDHVIAVSYHLTVPGENGGEEVTIEKTHADEPFTFLFGAGGLLWDPHGGLSPHLPVCLSLLRDFPGAPGGSPLRGEGRPGGTAVDFPGIF